MKHGVPDWSALRYGVPLLALASAPIGFALGGWACWLTIVATPAALLSLDWLLGTDADADAADEHWGYRLLPWLYAPLQVAVVIWAAATIQSGRASLIECLGLTTSVGVASGVFGMSAAHALVHGRSRADRGLGLMLLAFSGYMQFRIAHIHGHHRRAATQEDPASARPGESLYAFLMRSVIGQWREAWAFEEARLARRGLPAIHPGNRMIHYLLVEAVVAGGFAAMGIAAFAFWIAQAVLSVLLLEAFNYVAHYGLVRDVALNGRMAPMGPQHSWNASRRMNNWALFNMGRHTDHHRAGSRPYQRLEFVADAPELPCGYASALLLSLAPPLWRRVMDPRAAAWAFSSPLEGGEPRRGGGGAAADTSPSGDPPPGLRPYSPQRGESAPHR